MSPPDRLTIFAPVTLAATDQVRRESATGSTIVAVLNERGLIPSIFRCFDCGRPGLVWSSDVTYLTCGKGIQANQTGRLV
ncbi:hypothetical protein [Nocardia vaccinii]|uniref:hypothetical protein n=1 Tax=Nocardia vaccinii TaxID=1822 RepID=UPI00082F9117|nr:hypothetical protein [Nocardia vaccinii]